MRMELANGKIHATVLAVAADGQVSMSLDGDRPIVEILEEEGQTPLPPYITRLHGPEPEDSRRYQTVYARNPGAIAAPTAGMHFSGELLARLEKLGVRRTAVTLHVGPGTFKPVNSGVVEEHVMDPERFSIGVAAAGLINRTREEGGRIVAVGTTTVRVLETVAMEHGCIKECEGRTALFIRPPFAFKSVDVLLTNFHLPRTTLLMLVSAFAGTESVLRAYEAAVREKYRFYSYGDCMLIK